MVNFLNVMDLAFKPYFRMSDLVDIEMDSAKLSKEEIASYN